VTMGDALESAGLLELPYFETWVPDRESLEWCRVKLAEAVTSELVINEAQRYERVEKALEEAAKAYLEAGNRPVMVERLEEAARLLAWNGKVKEARWALAAAAEIKEEGSHPHLVIEMFRRMFPDLKRRMEAREPLEKAGAENSSGGGIIIP